MKQLGIELDMVVETKVSLNDFNDMFIKWVESNGWVCGGRMRAIDEDGNAIAIKEEI